jgi:hypothetical protein
VIRDKENEATGNGERLWPIPTKRPKNYEEQHQQRTTKGLITKEKERKYG